MREAEFNKTTTHLSVLSRRKAVWPLPALWLEILYQSWDFYRKCSTELCILKRKLQCLWTKKSSSDKELNLNFSFLSLLPQSFGFRVLKIVCILTSVRWMSLCEFHTSGSSCLSSISTGCQSGIPDTSPDLSSLTFPPTPVPPQSSPNSKWQCVLAVGHARHLARPFDLQSPYPVC